MAESHWPKNNGPNGGWNDKNLPGGPGPWQNRDDIPKLGEHFVAAVQGIDQQRPEPAPAQSVNLTLSV